MSSYTIDKAEYIKLAGLLYGHEANKPRHHRHETYMNQIRRKMEHCYTLNLISVNRQYNDNDVADEKSYDSEFDRHVAIGKRMRGADLLKTAVDFFRCANYQTEDKGCSMEMNDWFFTVILHIVPDGHCCEHIQVDESRLEPEYESILDMK